MNKSPYKFIVYTDASFKRKDDEGFAGYGAAILNTSNMTYCTFGSSIGNKTIAYAELWAIYKGIEKALKFIGHEKKTNILVVTDSKLSVNCLTYFLPYRWNLTDPDNWKTVNKKPVKNQAIFKAILELLRSYPNAKVRIAHIHGHTTNRDIPKLTRDLERHGIHADADTVELFRRMNAIVDEIAGSYVDRDIKMSKRNKDIPWLIRKELDDGLS